MKIQNIDLLFLAWILSSLAFGTEAATTYASFEFPILPGDGKWEKYESVSSRKEVLQIPDSILHDIPTPDLLQLCLDYPYNLDAYAFDNQQEGFRRVYASFNGYGELFSRNDFPQIAMEEIDKIPSMIDEVKDKDLLTQGRLSLRLKNLFNLTIINDGISKAEESSDKISEIFQQAIIEMKRYPQIFNLSHLLVPQTINSGFDESDESQLYDDLNITLPNGAQIEVSRLISGELSEAEKIAKKISVESDYGVEVLREATYTYNCHAYAWYMYKAHEMNPIWMRHPEAYWKTGCYYEVSENEAEVVTYGTEQGIEHSAIRINSNEYISKWGLLPLVKHSPNNVPNIYGKPFKYYKKFPNPVLSGPNTIEDSAIYSIGFLPKDFRVVWTLSDEYYSKNCMKVNDDGTCTITRQSGKWMNNATLTARIYVKDKLGWTVYKDISTTYDHNVPTYDINGLGQTTLTYPYIIYAKKGDAINISSPSLIKASVSYEGDVVPSRWVWDEYAGKVRVSLPSSTNGSALVVHINCQDGIKYDIVILLRDSRMSITTHIEGDVLSLSVCDIISELVSDRDNSDQASTHSNLKFSSAEEWDIEIMSFLAGTSVYRGKSILDVITIDISGWSPGIYAVRMKRGDIVLSEKIIIG